MSGQLVHLITILRRTCLQLGSNLAPTWLQLASEPLVPAAGYPCPSFSTQKIRYGYRFPWPRPVRALGKCPRRPGHAPRTPWDRPLETFRCLKNVSRDYLETISGASAPPETRVDPPEQWDSPTQHTKDTRWGGWRRSKGASRHVLARLRHLQFTISMDFGT